MLRAGNCSSSEAGSVLLSPQSPPQPQPPRWDVSTSTTAPRHGQGGFRLHRGAWTPVALSSAPKATLSLSHGWSCPSPTGAFIPALWVTLSLPHRWPCLSPVPSPMGAPVLTLAGWSQTSPGTGDPSPGPSSGSERTGAGGWAGCQPHHGHPPPASQHQGPPPPHQAPGTHTHNLNNPLPSTLLPTRGRGTPRHPPAPCTQGWVGGSRWARTGCHRGWDPAAAVSPPQLARILFTGGIQGCPPTPEQSRHPKKSHPGLAQALPQFPDPCRDPSGWAQPGCKQAPTGVQRGAGHPAPPHPAWETSQTS